MKDAFLKKLSFFKETKFLSHLIVFLFLAGFVAYAWTEPASAPPGGNVDPPINTGSASQVKAGALGIGGVLQAFSNLIVNGKVGIGTASNSQLLNLKSSAGDAAIRLQANITPANQNVTFNYTGGPQTWTVPSWVTSINVTVKGAQGQNGSASVFAGGGVGGRGAIVSGNLTVTPGENLTIDVSGNGSNGGAPGGGGGGGGAGCTSCYGGAGGNAGLNGNNGSDGSHGSGPLPYDTCGGNGGGGGTQSSGGIGGSGTYGGTCLPNSPGFNGNSLWGGLGGTAPTNYYNGNGAGGGGGGGGGYCGGGGSGSGGYAGYTGSGGGGGGGGSSLVPVGGSVSTGQTGNGQVIITYSSNADTNWIFGAGPSTNGKFKVSNSSAFGTTDALVLDDQGIILKAFNGSNCYRIRVDNTGAVSSISVTCP